MRQIRNDELENHRGHRNWRQRTQFENRRSSTIVEDITKVKVGNPKKTASKTEDKKKSE